MKIRKLKNRESILITGKADIADNIARNKINELIDRLEKAESEILQLRIKYGYIRVRSK